MQSSLQLVLEYLLLLQQQALAFSSIKVHMAANSAFHLKVDSRSVFSHKMIICFLKRMETVFPQIKELISSPPGRRPCLIKTDNPVL